MRLVVIIVAALMILGLAALGLVLAQRGTTSTATAASTVRIASETQEVSALPTRAPVGQIAQATGSEAPPLILQANVGVQSGSPMATVTQAPSAAAAAPNVKDQNPSTIAKALVHEATRLKDDATGWGHKLQELELDLNLQLDLKKNQDVEVAGKDINECLVVLRAAAGRLLPDAETRVTLRPSGMGKGKRAAEVKLHPHPTSQTSRPRTFRSTSDRPAKDERKHPRILSLGDISKRVSASKVNAKFSLKELLNPSEKARVRSVAKMPFFYTQQTLFVENKPRLRDNFGQRTSNMRFCATTKLSSKRSRLTDGGGHAVQSECRIYRPCRRTEYGAARSG